MIDNCILCQAKMVAYDRYPSPYKNVTEYQYKCLDCITMVNTDFPAFWYWCKSDNQLKTVDIALDDMLVVMVFEIPRTIFYKLKALPPDLKALPPDIKEDIDLPWILNINEMARISYVPTINFNQPLNKEEFRQRIKMWMTFS